MQYTSIVCRDWWCDTQRVRSLSRLTQPWNGECPPSPTARQHVGENEPYGISAAVRSLFWDGGVSWSGAYCCLLSPVYLVSDQQEPLHFTPPVY